MTSQLRPKEWKGMDGWRRYHIMRTRGAYGLEGNKNKAYNFKEWNEGTGLELTNHWKRE